MTIDQLEKIIKNYKNPAGIARVRNLCYTLGTIANKREEYTIFSLTFEKVGEEEKWDSIKDIRLDYNPHPEYIADVFIGYKTIDKTVGGFTLFFSGTVEDKVFMKDYQWHTEQKNWVLVDVKKTILNSRDIDKIISVIVGIDELEEKDCEVVDFENGLTAELIYENTNRLTIGENSL